jgi:hypothetical protein
MDGDCRPHVRRVVGGRHDRVLKLDRPAGGRDGGDDQGGDVTRAERESSG